VSVLIFLIVFYILVSISLYFLFPKADVPANKALIPGVNFIEWAKIIGRPTWWPLLLLIPILNIFIFAGMSVDLVRSFAKYKFKHTAAAVLCAPLAFFLLSKKADAKYDGPNYIKEKAYNLELRKAQKDKNKRKIESLLKKSPYKKSLVREWTESIFFAVFAAAFIRMFLIEAFVIPTPSMEGSLMVGDFLFVSKPSYGIRTPMTIAMFPLLHNRMPKMDAESYLKKPSLKYNRLPALEDIARNKPFVFNWPAGDSVYVTSFRPWSVSQVAQRPGLYYQQDRELIQKVKKKKIITRPIDKRDHYIKRCVAVAGDLLQIKDGQIYINGEAAENPENIQFQYNVSGIGQNVSRKQLEKLNIAQTVTSYRGSASDPTQLSLNQTQYEGLKALSDKITLKRVVNPKNSALLFPNDPKNFPGWSVDDYGPVWIPKAGETIDIDMNNISLYWRIIKVYENNTLLIKNNKIIVNGEAITQYTFKQDYYWAMGDNRHNSEDSRSWGFVPHDHIVGKPLFIWFSLKNSKLFDGYERRADGKRGKKIEGGIRFDRIFKSANVD